MLQVVMKYNAFCRKYANIADFNKNTILISSQKTIQFNPSQAKIVFGLSSL
jgi:hypothetical protein